MYFRDPRSSAQIRGKVLILAISLVAGRTIPSAALEVEGIISRENWWYKTDFWEINMAGFARLLGALILAFGLFPLSPVAATVPAPTKPPVGPVITGVVLNPASTLLQQPCPVVLVFHGNITTTRAASVTYTWVDSHGRTWPQHRRRFSLPGVNGVSHKWKLGKPGKTVDEWVQLKVISPEERLSNKAPVHFACVK